MAQTTPTCAATIAVEGRTVLCQGETTTLRANTGTGLTYEWIRDGIVLASTGETLQVSTAGSYQVRVSGGSCLTNTSSETIITVNPRPNRPNFTIDPTTVACADTELTFSVNAPQTDEIYTWDFGDGSTRRGATVTYTYTDRGTGTRTYTVSLVATSTATSCESEVVTRDIQVRPRAEISFTEVSEFITCLNDTIEDDEIEVTAEITNTTEEPYLTDIRSYFVDWGDGNGEVQYTAADFPISSPNPYTEVGDYPIIIRAVTGNGCDEIFEQTYSVSREPEASINFSKEPAETPSSCTPIIVSLGDSSSLAEDFNGANLTYQWEIQDQNNIGGYEIIYGALDQDSLQIRFENSGVFQIQLVVTNGCSSDTASQSVIVGWPQVQLPGDVTACGDTTISYDAQNVFYDANFGNTVTYEWFINGSLVSTEQYPSLNFTSPGTYTVNARITNECGSSDDIGPPQPQTVTVNPLPSNPVVQGVTVCEGNTATIRPTGPGPAYQFFAQANGGTPLFTGTSFTTQALTQNTTYYVQTISSQGCPSERIAVTVTVVPAIADNTITAPTLSICAGDAPGTLEGSTPTGGTGSADNYTWLVSTTGPTEGFTPASGVNSNINYTPDRINATTWFRRVVSTVGSCSPDTSDAISIEVVPRVENNTISEAQEICANEVPAMLTGTRPTGGDGTDYEYVWEVSTESATTGFVTAPGTSNTENYSPDVLTQDSWFRRRVTSGGCSVVSNVIQISVFPELANNTIEGPQEICTGTAPVPLTGSAPTGGSGSYNYLWESSTSSATAGFAPAAGTNNGQSYTPGNLSRTTWFRRKVSTAACDTATSDAVEITVNPGVINNSISADQTVCAGGTPNELNGSTPSGGNGSFEYVWESSISGPDIGFAPAAGTNNAQNYSPGVVTRNTWYRRVITSAGCSSTSDPVAIMVTPVPLPPTLTISNATACTGGATTLSVANPVSGNTYRWYTTPAGGNMVFEGPDFTTPELTQSVTYYVEAINSNSCASSTRTEATVTVVTPEANAGDDVTIIQGRTIELHATGGETYVWEPAEGLSDANVARPVARPEVTTTYTVTVTTAEGCVATDEVTVTVVPALSIPNAFSPNRDGVNEIWELGNIEEYPNARVDIFNRWGNIIYSNNSGYNIPWDGTFNGKDLPVATYYYIIYLNSSEKPISGNVTIIR
ncbi:gliding motility-associated C-terminal domain-containing protein [Pontibacter silvestris]|uniref:Gliding motility-associated C-terminal domain-containing protein n=1 Tax=Pontibacter silvestris TaxID=2305183 RepID=A0ABW4X144_9BACT|nr:gliding motility-associated C-terminal domain-containing protein [Pontibacter silvestris]MCC9135779.1 gliding motility-associated C-terminal domain-containing protein [Pontibacter silvestris]